MYIDIDIYFSPFYYRAMTFDGGVVGKALKGPICTYEYSGGVNMVYLHIYDFCLS